MSAAQLPRSRDGEGIGLSEGVLPADQEDIDK